MFDFLGIDYNYVLENRKNGKELKIPVSRNFKCVFTKNGEIVIYDGDEHAEWIPFEGMWLCEDCYRDLKY